MRVPYIAQTVCILVTPVRLGYRVAAKDGRMNGTGNEYVRRDDRQDNELHTVLSFCMTGAPWAKQDRFNQD